jgi:putative membrane protein
VFGVRLSAARETGASADEAEPDARFTFANERTFLAWTRTALAFVVAELGIVQLLPPFPGVPLEPSPARRPPDRARRRHRRGQLRPQWAHNQRALRRGEPLPRSVLPRILAATITGMAIVSAVVLLLSAILKP